mgnify:FL=1
MATTTVPAYELHPVVRRALGGLCVEIPPHCVGVHGRLYDVTRLDHPGGDAWIAACSGIDATALFESMHLNHERARALLETLPQCGTYTPAIQWDFRAYRGVARRCVARGRFGSRAARRETPAAARRFGRWAAAAAALHVALLALPPYSAGAWAVCVLAAVANTVLGGMGHNYLHRMDPRALGLDWNGLSSFEWCLEHVASHHPMPNTPHDHDSLSMLPFVSWLEPRRSNLAIYALFFVGEIAVALQGCVGHRCRWKAARFRTPAWMRHAPWLFVARVASHVLCQGLVWGGASLLCTLAFASFYFSLLAHLNHAPCAPPTLDFLQHQLGTTRDLRAPRCLPEALVLGLDRQGLHHLFPSVDHSRLDEGARRLAVACGAPLRPARGALGLCREMHARLTDGRSFATPHPSPKKMSET